MNYTNGLSKLLIIASSDLLDSSFSVESHSDCLIGLNKLVQFLGEFLILNSDDSDVIVEGINLDLQIGVVVQQGRIAVSGTFKFFSHIHDLVFLRSNL